MNTLRIIVNADDFGMSHSINQAVLKGFESGNLTGTSLMVNGHAFEEAVDIAKKLNIPVGLHLCIVGGESPISESSEIPTLINKQGRFYENIDILMSKYFLSQISLAEIEVEFRRQLNYVLSTGLPVTHLDSHRHVHILPGIFSLTLRLAQEHRIPFVRSPQEVTNAVDYLQFPPPIKLMSLKILSSIATNRLHHTTTQTTDGFSGVMLRNESPQKVIDRTISQTTLSSLEFGIHVATDKRPDNRRWDNSRDLKQNLRWVLNNSDLNNSFSRPIKTLSHAEYTEETTSK